MSSLWEMVMNKVIEALKRTFFSNTWLGAAMWFVAAVGLLSILVWFLVYSGLGAPAAPVYENF